MQERYNKTTKEWCGNLQSPEVRTVIFLCLSLDRTWQKVKWPKGQIIAGIRGEARSRAETRTLLDYVGHRPTECNVALLSLAGRGHNHGTRHGCLIIAEKGQRSPVRYKSDKGVEVGALPASSLPLLDNTGWGQSPWQINAVDICLCLSPDRTWHKVNDLKIDYSGDLGEGKVGHKPRLGICWSSAHLMQCGAWWA